MNKILRELEIGDDIYVYNTGTNYFHHQNVKIIYHSEYHNTCVISDDGYAFNGDTMSSQACCNSDTSHEMILFTTIGVAVEYFIGEREKHQRNADKFDIMIKNLRDYKAHPFSKLSIDDWIFIEHLSTMGDVISKSYGAITGISKVGDDISVKYHEFDDYDPSTGGVQEEKDIMIPSQFADDTIYRSLGAYGEMHYVTTDLQQLVDMTHWKSCWDNYEKITGKKLI